MIRRRDLPRALMFALMVAGGGIAGSALAAQVRDVDRGEAKVRIRLLEPVPGAGRRFVVDGLPGSQLRRLAAAAAESPDVWLDTLVVAVASDAAEKPRPMLGEFSIDGTSLVFRPRFPLRLGTTYRVEVVSDADRGKPPVARDFALAAPAASAPTRLSAVYPSSNVLPENQLKFYLQFSSPMSRGQAYRRVQLLDQNNKQVEFPFLELGEELWDPAGTRFTLFFDPGRIKRGLKPRELFGPALEEGQSYTLVIDGKWEDAQGRPLEATHRKTFKVAGPDDKQPAPGDWQIVTPAAEGRQPLVVSFGEPLDYAMLQRVLRVTREGHGAVAGRIVVSKQESQWSFQPDAQWPAGKYSLDVDTALEDLAGNSIGRPFEVDVFENIDRKPPQATVRIPFEILP